MGQAPWLTIFYYQESGQLVCILIIQLYRVCQGTILIKYFPITYIYDCLILMHIQYYRACQYYLSQSSTVRYYTILYYYIVPYGIIQQHYSISMCIYIYIYFPSSIAPVSTYHNTSGTSILYPISGQNTIRTIAYSNPLTPPGDQARLDHHRN